MEKEKCGMHTSMSHYQQKYKHYATSKASETAVRFYFSSLYGAVDTELHDFIHNFSTNDRLSRWMEFVFAFSRAA